MLLKGYMPLLLAIYDYWYIQRKRPPPPPDPLSDSDSDYYDDVDEPSALARHLSESPARYISPTAFLAVAQYLATWVLASPRSTYICPLSAFAHNNIVIFQLLGTLFDIFVLLKIMRIVMTFDPKLPLQDRITPRIISYILFVSLSSLLTSVHSSHPKVHSCSALGRWTDRPDCTSDL